MVSDPPNIPPWDDVRDRVLGDSRITASSRAVVLLGMRIDSYLRSIRPWLRKDRLVLSDRFLDSWFSYQLTKVVKQLKTDARARIFLESLNKICLDNKLLEIPDRTFLIVADISETTRRGRQKARSVYDDIRTQRQVQRNYLRLASLSHGRIELIDSKGLSIEQVTNVIEERIRVLML